MVAAFSDVFPILHRYLGETMKNHEYVELFITQLTREPIDFNVKNRQYSQNAYEDLIANVSKERLRQWYKRGFTEKIAKGILSRYTDEYFFNALNDLPEESAEMLVKDLKPVLPAITEKNYANEIIDWIKDYLYFKAKRKRLTPQENAVAKNESEELKQRFGSHLLREAEFTCMTPGCGHRLTMLDTNGRSQDMYEVVPIDPSKNLEPYNIAALCPRCAINYREAANKKIQKEMLIVKKQLNTNLQITDAISSTEIGKDLTRVIAGLKRYKSTDMKASITYDVVTVSEKIDEVNEYILYTQVQNAVSTYYPIVHSILQDLETSGEIDSEQLRHDIKGDYLKIRHRPRPEIFDSIVKNMVRATKADILHCAIIAAYFVQSCDIFTEDPKLVGRGHVAA